jgi:hypothetical protein
MRRVVHVAFFVGLLATSARLAGQLVRPTLLPPPPVSRSPDQAFDLLETFVGPPSDRGADIAFAAGWGHLVLVRNNGVTLFRKSNGTDPAKQLAAVSVGAFFARVSQAGDALTDPYVVFDPDGGRFFLVMSPSPPAAQMNPPLAMLLAVSKSPYPETLTDADWYVYRLSRNESVNAVDFDKLAVAGDTLLVSWQRIDRVALSSLGATIRLLDKRALMSGTVPTPTDFVLASPPSSRARPASVASSRDRQTMRDGMFYDISRSCGPTNRLTWLIGAVTGIGTTAHVDTRQVVSPFPCASNLVMAPQPGGGQVRFSILGTTPAYYDGRLWVFADEQGTSGQTTSGIQWMELDVRGWPDAISVMQSGTYRESGVWFYVPAAAVDWAGNLVLTFVRSGPNDYPSASYTGRLVTDPVGTLRPVRPLRSGTRTWNSNSNLLDFSTLSVDPVDGSVWITGLVPSTAPPSGQGSEDSDAWIGRVRPMDATPTVSNGTIRR